MCPDAFHDSHERSPPPKCPPGTRTSVQGVIQSWAESISYGNRIMWLSGPPGAGKSAIAQTMAERWASDHSLAASFFFSRGKAGRGTSKHLFSTIAYQLALRTPELRCEVGRVVERDPTISERSIDVQLRKLIVEPFQTAHRGDIPSPLIMTDSMNALKLGLRTVSWA